MGRPLGSTLLLGLLWGPLLGGLLLRGPLLGYLLGLLWGPFSVRLLRLLWGPLLLLGLLGWPLGLGSLLGCELLLLLGCELLLLGSALGLCHVLLGLGRVGSRCSVLGG